MKTMAIAWVTGLLLLAALPVLAQTSVTPPGSGTAADPYRISALDHLVWMGDTVGASVGTYYALQNDIAAAATALWNDAGTDGSVVEGFRPLGTEAAPFAGSFDGQGHVIRDLTVNRPATDGVGLFGWIGSAGVVRRLGLEGGFVTGQNYVGGLVGRHESGTLTQCYALGAVTGEYYVGGLVGRHDSGTVEQCYATGAVTGTGSVGGLVGDTEGGNVDRCYATGVVTGQYSVGGLVGYSAGTVGQCYAAATVTGEDVVGGLVGYNQGGTVEQCYATGTVVGKEDVGGLVGYNQDGTVTQCYATGAVAGTDVVGGLVGENDGAVEQCYWDTETSGWTTSAGGTGRSTVQMRQQSTYVGWDFTNDWDPVAAQSYPSLRWSPPPFALAVVASGPGSVSADPVQTAYPAGAVVTLQAIASVHAEFVRWLGPVASPTAGHTTVTVAGPLTVVGLFRVARVISSVQELQKIGRDPDYTLNGRYWLTQDVDATETALWNDEGTDTSVVEGFRPLGTEEALFVGEFDGQGHIIHGLTVNRPAWNAVGLFGWIGSTGAVRHLGLEGGSVTGLAGVGGLVGGNSGILTECYAAGPVTGHGRVGGLVGYNAGGTVEQCYATGAVTGGDDVGGLLGQDEDGTVTQCYATGAVTGADDVGGLLGQDEDGTVTQCYATGAVAGADYVGGLLGQDEEATVTQCYAMGAVTGVDYVGGLLGGNSGTLTECYATGAVTGNGRVGGLLGYNAGGTVVRSRWDTERSGRTASAGGEGRTTAQMRQQGTYDQWDFTNVWDIAADRNDGYPHLLRVGPWLLRLLAVVGTAEVGQGREWWDLTGTYLTSVAGYPLTLNLVHDSKGRVTGTAAIDGIPAGGAAVTTVNLSVKGSVRGVGGALVLKLRMQGAGSAGTVRVTLLLDLSLDAAAQHLSGPLTGSIRTATGTTPIMDNLVLDLPASMDGTWTLHFDLTSRGRARSGTALLTLAHDAEHLFTVSGNSSGQTLWLRLSGAGADPAARGIWIRTTITPLEGGSARLDAFSATGYGQTLNW